VSVIGKAVDGPLQGSFAANINDQIRAVTLCELQHLSRPR
jgi:hypothetical protein